LLVKHRSAVTAGRTTEFPELDIKAKRHQDVAPGCKVCAVTHSLVWHSGDTVDSGDHLPQEVPVQLLGLLVSKEVVPRHLLGIR
jgi:hypothetical protein